MPNNRRLDRSPADLLDYEIVQEQASALGRLGRALEAALAQLREFDDADPPSCTSPARSALVDAAGYALWMFVVQREACGLRDSRAVMRDYKVPPEVQYRMGVAGISNQGSGRRSVARMERSEIRGRRCRRRGLPRITRRKTGAPCGLHPDY